MLEALGRRRPQADRTKKMGVWPPPDRLVAGSVDRDREETRRVTVARSLHNRRLLVRIAGPFVTLTLGILLALVVHHACRREPRGLQRAHWYGLVFVLVAYLPEVLLFFAVINQHVAIGDTELVRLLLGYRD